MATTQCTDSAAAPIAPIADEKAQLITAALHTLRTAHALDERDDLDVRAWVAWYDATLPHVRDIKALAGTMDIELTKRRGAHLQAEGEPRGGKRTKSKVRQRLTLTPAEKFKRHVERTIAAHPARVDAYIKEELDAQRVPSVRGAVRAAKESHPMNQVAVAPTSASVPTKTSALTAGETLSQRALAELFRKLDIIADGTRRTDAQLAKTLGDVKGFLERVRVIPWLSVDRTTEGLQFVIDQELRDICERRRPRPALHGESIRTFLAHLRTEIDRRRKENHDKNLKSKWVTREVNVQQQRDLLDWIEQQLDLVTR